MLSDTRARSAGDSSGCQRPENLGRRKCFHMKHGGHKQLYDLSKTTHHTTKGEICANISPPPSRIKIANSSREWVLSLFYLNIIGNATHVFHCLSTRKWTPEFVYCLQCHYFHYFMISGSFLEMLHHHKSIFWGFLQQQWKHLNEAKAELEARCLRHRLFSAVSSHYQCSRVLCIFKIRCFLIV